MHPPPTTCFANFFILWTILWAAATSPPGAGDSPRGEAREPTRIAFRESRLVDHYYWLRHLADPASAITPDARYADSVETVRVIGRKLGHPLAWGLLEASLVEPSVHDAGDLAALYAKLPESARLLDRRTVALRECGRQLTGALQSSEEIFVTEVWPEHQRVIAAARRQLLPPLEQDQRPCLQEILSALGMSDPATTVPVWLVAESPWPGGFTHRRRNGGICFIGLDGFAGRSQLWEGILHEAIHALDVATSGQKTVLGETREALRRAGLPGDLARNIVHTIMFAQAAATVRGRLAPGHRPYGEVSGYYERVGAAGRIVPAAWTAYRSGELTHQQFIDRLVAEGRQAAGREPVRSQKIAHR